MATIKQILKDTGHRPYPLPEGSWSYYQEWNNALFFHWRVPESLLKPWVPEELTIDTFESEAWVSVVAFTMQKIRPRYLPSVRFISDFHEVNVRTYVTHEGKAGVYFLNIEAQKKLSAWISRKLSGLPYEKSNIVSIPGNYHSFHEKKKLLLKAEFDVSPLIRSKTALELWLTERYCLYMQKNGRIYRYDIQHQEWELNELKLRSAELCYVLRDLDLSIENVDLIQYSKGVQVLAWPKVRLT